MLIKFQRCFYLNSSYFKTQVGFFLLPNIFNCQSKYNIIYTSDLILIIISIKELRQIPTLEMAMQKKSFKKNNLKIEIAPEGPEDNQNYKLLLQATKSAKNNHELKRFNFNQVKPAGYVNEKNVKQERIKKLQKQKEQLLQSLQMLTNGAVSAIVQKDEIITKLKKIFAESPYCEGEYRDDSKIQQFENLLQYIRDLQYERNTLKEEAQRRSSLYQNQIRQRQLFIQQLTSQLNWSTQRIENLEKYDQLLEQKIRALHDNNQNLKFMLNQSQETLKDERRKLSQQSQLVKNKSTDSFNIQGGSDSQNGSNLAHSSMRKYNYGSQDGSIHNQFINLSRSLDESIIQTKIQELKNQHLTQIQDLTDFYESRIQTLKKLCQNYSQFPYISNQQNFAVKINKGLEEKNTAQDIRLITQTNENQSTYSNITNETYQKLFVPIKQKDKQQEKKLKKNLSLCSINSGGFANRIQPIDQRQQMQSPKRSLRHQLLNFNVALQKGRQVQQRQQSRKTSRIHSENSIQNHSQSSKNQRQSQKSQRQSKFSYKYFEYPKSSFKKNKTINLSKQNSQANSPLRIQPVSTRRVPVSVRHPRQQQLRDFNCFDTRSTKSAGNSERIKQQKNSFWEKFLWFTSGTITGGLLLTIGNKILK